MAKVVLDTNFIMNAVREKFDFFEGILMLGHQILIPKEVLAELERLSRQAPSKKDKDIAAFSLKIISANEYSLISCPGRYVDKGIISYLEDKPEYLLATYDKGLKKKVQNRILVLRGKKKLEIV